MENFNKILLLHILDKFPNFGTYYGLSQIIERLLIRSHQNYKKDLNDLIKENMVLKIGNYFRITDKGISILEEKRSFITVNYFKNILLDSKMADIILGGKNGGTVSESL